MNYDEVNYRFYYCESEDSYLLGHRVGNFYYAHWHEGTGFVFDMSRYLPWGETIEAPETAWKIHTYPSEPVEIDTNEWFRGFIAKHGTIDPPVKRGEWVVEEESSSSRLVACSVCERKFIVNINISHEEWAGHKPYCDQCGADMRTEDK